MYILLLQISCFISVVCTVEWLVQNDLNITKQNENHETINFKLISAFIGKEFYSVSYFLILIYKCHLTYKPVDHDYDNIINTWPVIYISSQMTRVYYGTNMTQVNMCPWKVTLYSFTSHLVQSNEALTYHHIILITRTMKV